MQVADGRQGERDTLRTARVEVMAVDAKVHNGNGERPGQRHDDLGSAPAADIEPETVEVVVGEIEDLSDVSAVPEADIKVVLDDDDLEDELTAADFGGSTMRISRTS